MMREMIYTSAKEPQWLLLRIESLTIGSAQTEIQFCLIDFSLTHRRLTLPRATLSPAKILFVTRISPMRSIREFKVRGSPEKEKYLARTLNRIRIQLFPVSSFQTVDNPYNPFNIKQKICD